MIHRLVCVAACASVACDDHLFPAGAGAGGDCEPTWDGVQVFMEDHCMSCHAAPAAAGKGIILPDAITQDLANLGEPMFPEYGGELVVPNNRDASVLWKAVSHEGFVPVMPFLALDPAAGYECVGEWIDAGAVID